MGKLARTGVTQYGRVGHIGALRCFWGCANRHGRVHTAHQHWVQDGITLTNSSYWFLCVGDARKGVRACRGSYFTCSLRRGQLASRRSRQDEAGQTHPSWRLLSSCRVCPIPVDSLASEHDRDQETVAELLASRREKIP